MPHSSREKAKGFLRLQPSSSDQWEEMNSMSALRYLVSEESADMYPSSPQGKFLKNLKPQKSVLTSYLNTYVLQQPDSAMELIGSRPLGDVIYECGKDAGVDMEGVVRREGEVGTYHVIPQEKRVHYQRSHSVWAMQQKGEFLWSDILAQPGNLWLHVTGITPMTTDVAASNWGDAIQCALDKKIPVSMDFNHRPQLGPLSKLWGLTKPFVSKLYMLVLSVDSLKGIAELEGIPTPSLSQAEDAINWAECLLELHTRLQIPRVACCFKTRNQNGVQKRWSVVCHGSQAHSTADVPTFHKPKDECGGGSAWMAGFLDMIFQEGSDVPVVKAARRADILAALCQEIIGDHSNVTRQQLQVVEKKYEGKVAHIGTTVIEENLERLKKARVVAIIRAKNSRLAIERALELVEMGYQALEVTMDTEDVLNVLKTLVEKIPPEKCLLGAGTVLNVEQVQQIAAIGVKFAISPINPEGFTAKCNELGLVAMPAAFTPNEIWTAHQQGAHAIKVFPAQLWNPSSMKDLLNVGQFGSVLLMPSGGITPETAMEWLSNGAALVGMASKLTGGDLRLKDTDPNFQSVHEEWEKNLRLKAVEFMERLKSS